MAYRILIIDDEEDIRQLLKLTLGKKYEVVEAISGEDALNILDNCEPDLITLDIMMPGFSGFEICQMIRSKTRYAKTPIIMFSAMNEKEAHVGGYEVGASLYLEKTLSPDLLIRNIEFLLSQAYSQPHAKRYAVSQIREAAYNKDIPDDVKKGFDINNDDTIVPFVNKPAPPSEKPIVGQNKNVSSKYRIVFIDDDEEILDMLRFMFQDEYEVITAKDGMEGINKINMYEPDLIVLDVMLPKFSGYQVKQTLDRVKLTSSIPVMFLTAKADEKSKLFAEKLHPAAYMTKPFESGRLSVNIRNILRNYYPTPKTKRYAYNEYVKLEEEKQKKLSHKKKPDDSNTNIKWIVER